MAKAKSNNSYTTQGERNAMSGYLPQYEEFARCIYDHLVDGTLVEMRVADYDENVGKLDDICYVTTTEVHAYQVKWSIKDRVLRMAEFKSLLPEVVDGWEKIQAIYPNKKVVPHLLTNRERSLRFDIAKAESDAELRKKSKLSMVKWHEFWKVFVFTPEYVQENFDISHRSAKKRIADVIDLVFFIIGKVAGEKGTILVTKQEIINGLNWNDRFDSLYNHNLVVSETSYEPNKKAIDLLNAMLKSKTKGYIFLKGTPGSGKSTILTQWVRSIPNRTWRYYAFDFTEPTSQRFNDTPRGEADTFLYDIVQEIEATGYGSSDTLLYKEYHFLKKRFYELLKSLSEEYRKTKLQFLIVIDGLDHITREYNIKQTSLMEVLPSDSDIPDGVVFVLGSQHYENLGLNKDIENDSKNGKSLIEMPPFTKEEVGSLVTKILGHEVATGDLIVNCIEKSQGHPLYLRYILNQIKNDGVDIVGRIAEYDNDVEAYYDRIIGSSLSNAKMKQFLGLLSRVIGAVNLDTIRMWKVEEQMLVDFKREMWHLFKHSDDGNTLSFFHNSFRQYLLNKTAIDVLTEKYSHEINLEYYNMLSKCFVGQWDEGYYLYQAEAYNEFIERITPEMLFKQAQHFRPLWSIRKDLKYAISIAKQKKDVYLLVRCLLFEAQLSQMENLGYSSISLVEDLVKMGETSLAKAIIREDNKLHCEASYALIIAKSFLQSGNKTEASKLFDLAYPDYIVNPSGRRSVNRAEINEELSKLKMWVNTASYFISWVQIEEKIELFVEYLRKVAQIDREKFHGKSIRDTFTLEYTEALIEQSRWEDVEIMLKRFDGKKRLVPIKYVTLREAALKCNENRDKDKALKYYNQLENAFKLLPQDDRPYFQMAYIGWKIGIEQKQVFDYLKGVAWDDFDSYYQTEVHAPFKDLRPRIAYLKLRTALGFDDKITDLVPTDSSNTDNALMEQYVRKVFYLAKLCGRAMGGQYVAMDLMSVFDNYLVFFDDLSLMHHNKFEYTILCQRADFYEYLIEVAVQCGQDVLVSLANKMDNYFSQSSCEASAESKRRSILALYNAGIERQLCLRMLNSIEGTMMGNKDLYGRAEEAFAQGKAWLEVGETEKARKLYGDVILESFGIGYRKDYQTSLFVDWLGIADNKDTGKIIERIHWITSRLRYIQEVSEGRAAVLAGEALLENTLKFDLGSGIKLAKWLLDKEFGYYQSISKIILEAMLEKVTTKEEFNIILSYYTKLHLYFDDRIYETDTQLLESIFAKSKSVYGLDIEEIKSVLQKHIKTNCPENIIDTYLEALEKVFGEQGVDNREENRSPDVSLKETWDTAMEAIRQSGPSGWVRYYDGGTRIDACKKLQEIDKDKGRDITFNLLADDIDKGYNYSIMRYLDEIVPLMTEKVDYDLLFEERFAYMNRILRDNTVCAEDMPDIAPTCSSIVEAIEDWLLFLAETPVVCLSEAAMMILARLVDKGRSDIIEKIKCESDSERRLLELGMYLKEMRSCRLSLLKQQALQSAVSDNYLNRIYAKAILNDLKELVPKPKFKPLSPTYQMSFATKPKYDWGDVAEKKEGVRDWNDSSSIMLVASHITRYLAYVTGFEQKAIEERAVSLMRKYGSVTEDNEREDKRIAKHYDSIGLRFPYRRAHAMAALDGAYEAAAELIDGNAVNGRYDDDWFLSYDFKVINLAIEEKPEFIQRIAEKECRSVPDVWDTDSRSSPRFGSEVNRYKGMNVIGEFTHILKCEDKMPVEEYLSKISYDNVKTDADKFFGNSAYQQQSSKYLELGSDDSQLIIFRGGYYSIASIKLRWIAINPAFALAMGWLPSETGIFAWDDIDGNRMVESVYWQNGNVNGRDRSNYEASEGWLVVASDKAMQIIKSVASVYLHKIVQRGFHAKKIEFPNPIYRSYRL